MTTKRGRNLESAITFTTFIRRQGARLRAEVEDRWRKFSFLVLRLSVQATPVDTGRARNGWHVTIGSVSGEDVVAGSSPSAVIAAGKAEIDAAKLGSKLWLQNNVPYILVLEFGLFEPPDPGPSKDRRKGRFGRILVRGGYSVQAPSGMLRDAVQEASTFYGIGG